MLGKLGLVNKGSYKNAKKLVKNGHRVWIMCSMKSHCGYFYPYVFPPIESRDVDKLEAIKGVFQAEDYIGYITDLGETEDEDVEMYASGANEDISTISVKKKDLEIILSYCYKINDTICDDHGNLNDVLEGCGIIYNVLRNYIDANLGPRKNPFV